MPIELYTQTEAGITQGQLLQNLFNNDIEEEPQLPVYAENNSISLIHHGESTDIVSATFPINLTPTGTNLEIVPVMYGNIITNQIRDTITNTWYHITTSSTSATTNCVIKPIHTTSCSTSTLLINPFTGTTVGISTFNNIYTTGTGTNFIYQNSVWLGDVIPEKVRSVKKFVKNSIKRALKLLDNFGMEEDTKIFLSGKEVEISHPDSLFKFVISKYKYPNIIRATEYPGHSVPFVLSLRTKSDIHVADLCVYAKDTPMLDNLFMVAMYVKSGNEEELLTKANFNKLSKDMEIREIISLEHPYLRPKLLRNQMYDR